MTSLLSERESDILSATIRDYIQTAQPVASRRVRDRYDLHVSAATIRNTMAELERLGYLTHPHTSSGKVPTDKGYRTYVDDLMIVAGLHTEIVARITQNLEQLTGDIDKLLRILAHIISRLSGGVGITIAPVNLKARLSSVRLVPVSHHRLLFVLELHSGSVQTVVAEWKLSVKETQLVLLEEILNERLSDLTLEEIQATIGQRLEGTLADELGITALILDHSADLLMDRGQGDLYLFGLQQVLKSPEFGDQTNIATLLSLVENEDMLRAVICRDNLDPELTVMIGHEHGEEQLERFATISCGYFYGDSIGTMAVLAPKRVNYPHVFAVLEFIRKSISEIG
ncbi:MAG: heat-inducible transcription repressor HrcA [Fidelibacterota bacterium]|nr:MAG: heat-inducible transcription repressor HrcA [Candidatus Neomarinimicrobiota bacterium]